ncbi:MAG: hypothetical protein ABII13_05400 [Patescibacteria group bacterium]|nr:hypothetical protein [Patescibacteria group bacterium]
MTEKTKKILFIAGFVVLSVAIGFALYYFFFRPLISPTEEAPTVPADQIYGGLPTAGEGVPGAPTEVLPPGLLPPTAGITPGEALEGEPSRVTLLYDAVSQAVTPSPDGQGARFYDPDDGRFYRVNPDGSITRLGDKQFFNVENVSWGQKTDKAVLEFPDGSNVLYDFTAKRQTTLPKHWEEFAFSPDDEQIVAKSIGIDPSNRFLIVTSPDGNEARAIEPLGQNANKTIVEWSPNNQVIAFALTGKPQPDGAQEVLLIGENRENFKSLIVPGRGFQPNWSPTGKQILYSVYHERDEFRPSLWVSGGVGDQIGEDRRGLNLKTWADKCAWVDENDLICGVPQSLEIGAGLAPQNFTNVPDDVYRVNLRTGVSTKINTPDQIYPISNPVVSADKSKLIFSDASTGRLYEYDLP